jgi:hypothetical protein
VNDGTLLAKDGSVSRLWRGFGRRLSREQGAKRDLSTAITAQDQIWEQSNGRT